MDTGVILILFITIILLFFILGFRVTFAIGICSILLMCFGLGTGINPSILVSRMFRGINSFVLLAIPFFLMVGKIMNSSSITTKIFGFCSQLVGNVRGGMGYVVVLISMIFAGMSGLAIADAAAIGPVAFKAMTEKGFPKKFTVGLVGAGAVIGPIIPPSMPLVIYAVLAGESVGKMLIAGLLPGITIGIALGCMVYYCSIKYNLPKGEPRTLKKFFKTFWASLPAFGTPLILLGGIITGIFTVTEAAAAAAMYSLILALFVFKDITWKDVWKICKSTAMDSAVLLILVAAAQIYAYLAVTSRIPVILTEKILIITHNPLLVLFLINIILLIMGCFLDSTASITLMTPILIPLITTLGISTVQFGIILVLNLMIGLLTPPFGILLFVLNKTCKTDMKTTVSGVFPFFVPLIAVLLLVTILPVLSTGLVNVFFK